MKKSNSKGKALSAFKKLGAVVLITATMCFTACNQAGGGGGKPTPTLKPTKYMVTLNQAEHGKVTASPEIPADKQVAKDTVITFTATANAGYKVGKWKVTPAEAVQAGTGTEGSATAKVKITANTTVSVSFEAIPKHAITFSVDSTTPNGKLTAKADGIDETETSPINVEEGKTVTFTATANDGYRVKGWTLDGNAVNGSNNSYSFPVTKACTVKVSFEDNSTPKPKHAINFSVDGANGTLKAKADGIDETSTSPITVEEGKTITFTAEPSTGYKVKEWKVGDTVVTGNKTNTYAHTVTEAVTVKVSFEANSNPPNPPTPTPTKYTVTLNKTEHGKLTASPEIPEDKKVDKNTVITFTAKANDGYKIGKWTVTGSVLEAGTGADGSSTAKVKITADTTVSLSFEVIPPTKYTVTLNKTEHGKVTASPEIPANKLVVKDTVITFTATANNGYKIGKWTVTGSVLEAGTGADGSSTAKVKITADTTVAVSFEAIPKHAITFSVEGTGGMLKAVVSDKEINSGDEVEQGKQVTFTATANTGYRVNSWVISPSSAIQSGGNKGETTAKVKITANTTVSVSFEAIPKYTITFSVDSTTPNGKLTAKADGIDETETSPINVEECKTVTFTAKAEAGYKVKEWKVDGNVVAGNTSDTYTHNVTKAVSVKVSFELVPVARAILTLNPSKLYIKIKAKTADGSAITVEGCNKTTLESDTDTYLDANGTTVTLIGKITELKCSDNALTELNVQGLTALQELYCGWNKLTSLNVQGLTALQKLYCHENQLTSLNVQGLTSLQELYCKDNQLPELNVQGLTSLQKLYCNKNQLPELNVQGLTALQELYCGWNKLTSLNVQGLTTLQKLDCWSNQLTELNVQGLTTLQVLECYYNQLTELNVQGLNALQKLDCKGNDLTELNVQGLTALQNLNCGRNKLTALDVSGMTSLQILFCDNITNWDGQLTGNGQLTTLDVHGCTSLQNLSCGGNKLTALDVSSLTALQKLECKINQLTALNVQGLTALQELYCYRNKLTELNVQGCASLQKLYCAKNQLTELNVQGLTALQELGCWDNQLTALNVQGCTSLQKLECNKNQLTSLNVQGCVALQKLDCSENQLASLNVQGCTALKELKCYRNKLTELNVQGLTALQELDCSENQLAELNVQGCTSLKELGCHRNQLNAKAMTKLLNALPARVASDYAKAILYTGYYTEGNCKDYAQPEDLKKAFDEAKKRNWRLQKGDANGWGVDI